jgi:hypothetical protein
MNGKIRLLAQQIIAFNYIVTLALGLSVLALPVYADPLVADDSAINGAINPGQLSPDSPAEEEAWLENVLGYSYNSSIIVFAGKVDFNPEIANALTNYDPGFVWDYAVVKIGGSKTITDHFAFSDFPDDNKLTINITDDYDLKYDISHITFFSLNNSVPVPEPATMLLFGTGIAGLAAAGRRKKN